MTGPTPLLALLTVGATCDVCILKDAGAEPVETSEPGLTGQDARLPHLVDECLRGAGLGMGDIKRLAVCTGPGSFTGVRVGVAYARGLAVALKVPCIGITSTLAAVDPSELSEPVRVALAAKRRPPDRTVWTQLIGSEGPLSAPEEWELDRLQGETVPLMGDLEPEPEFHVRSARPSAVNIARWSLRLEPADAPPTPAYVRSPDAKLPGGVTL